MSFAEELHKLDELRTRGVLSDAEFQRAKQRLLDGPPLPPVGQAPGVTALNAFRRSVTDKWIGGVCGGLAKLTGIERSNLRQTGMADGFIITRIDKTIVAKPADVKALLENAENSSGVLVEGVYPDGRKAYYPIGPE